jgi:hypothetical protein
MYWLGLTFQWTSVALQVWIFVLMGRRNLYRRFPIFASYTAYVVMSAVLRSVFLSDWHIYFYVYWFTQPAEILLSVLAVHESFMRVFGHFYQLRWFRFLFPGTIAAALIYAGWKAYAHPPVGVNSAGSAIISIAIASQYVIFGIFVVFFLLVRFVHVLWRLYEFRIVLGFGVASLFYAFAGVLRSETGTRFNFLSEYLPGMGYLLAVLIWLSAMMAEEPMNGHNLAGMSIHEVLKALRLQLEVLKRFLAKS